MRRRSFLHLGSTAALAGLRPLRAQPEANAKIRHCAIGVNGMGWSDLNQLASHPHFSLAAVVDVDQSALDRVKADARFRDVRTYRDWREMLTQEGNRIDSVNVATPDHMHAIIAESALNHGKHVYGQKPLTQTVAEARRLAAAARRAGTITQMGNQIHSHLAYRMGVAWLRAGVIGKIRAVHSWINAKFPQPARPEASDPVPGALDWNLWLGVAPERPYQKDLYHPFQWRGWQDFGGGGMGDFGCHIWDPIFTALELGAPRRISAEVPPAWAEHPQRFRESWPDWEVITAEFPGTPLCAGETLTLTWYDGDKKPDPALAELPPGRNLPGGGSLILGTEGRMVLPHVNGPQLYPEDKFQGLAKPDIPKHVDHYHTWLDHIRSGRPTSDGFHYAGPLTEAVQLGNIANRFPGQTLDWDPVAFRFPHHPAATALLDRPYRDGWAVLGG
jgi:predicted dehydrogenase